MPSSKVKELLQYPGSWILILSILVQNILEVIVGEKQSLFIAIVFGIIAYIIDLYVVNRSRELFGLQKIKLLDLVWITFICGLKISVLPIIFLIIISSILSSTIGWNFGIAEIESNSFRVVISYALFGLWVSFCVNYAIFTNSTKNLLIRIFRIIKSSHKEIFPLALLYIISLVISGLLKKMGIWSNLSSVLIQVVAVFFYRLWFFEIFSNSKKSPFIETNDLELEANTEL